ncbi:MAG: hypothetical protein BV458_04610 [Thermoplasmata archaeon M9B2D]|nr:MAG: hypothetical protein BV458_04610 [Thermoplasmata archaeon M9B2D]
MSAKYIIRLDDASPTMDSDKWERIELLLDRYEIKPIVAVIPNNEDTNMFKNAEDIHFWDKVKRWQEKNWMIALHGYNHVYGTDEAGLVPFNKRSEFAGLRYEEQAEKIKNGISIFASRAIETIAWVAPSHSFDKNTLKALSSESSIKIVSDGIALYPYNYLGFLWIPQQFWKFRKMPFGIWTSCFHPNEMSDREFENLKNFIDQNHENFIDAHVLATVKRKKNLFDRLFETVYWFLRKK